MKSFFSLNLKYGTLRRLTIYILADNVWDLKNHLFNNGLTAIFTNCEFRALVTYLKTSEISSPMFKLNTPVTKSKVPPNGEFQTWPFATFEQPTGTVSTRPLFFFPVGLSRPSMASQYASSTFVFHLLVAYKATDVGGWQELSTLLS